MKRKRFTPEEGIEYRNQGGGAFICLQVLEPGKAVMQNTASGWTLKANGIGIYEDGSVDWDYSTEGRFEPIRRQRGGMSA